MPQPSLLPRTHPADPFTRTHQRSPEVEHEYFSRRAADHMVLAETCPDEAQRSLHLRFATSYRERAAAIRSR